MSEQSSSENPGFQDAQKLKETARELRLDVLEMTTRAGSGHPSSCFSCAEILAVLYFGGILRYRAGDPWWSSRDRFIMSKGHAAPVLYAALSRAGYFPSEQLRRLREMDSPVQGHPVQGLLPGVEATTGSLGQGLSVGIGHVLGGRLAGLDYRVYVLLGDGECQEGQVWEAAMSASHFRTANLTAVLDYNKYQETGPITREMNLEPLADKWRSFGWEVTEADGHNIQEVLQKLKSVSQYREGPSAGRPSIVIAHTVKGKGVSFMEADYRFHGKALKKDQAEKARKELLCS